MDVPPYFSLIPSDVSNMLGHGKEKSSCVYAPTYDLRSPVLTASLSAGACVGFGHMIGFPSHLAIKKNRFLIVGAP